MRSRALWLCFAAFCVAARGDAQVYRFPTPPPAVTAASAGWQIRGEPVFYAGGFYYPTVPTVFFDGNVMMRTGVYRGVPLYEDSTRLPYTVVFVPIGRNLMRPYERVEVAPPSLALEGELLPEYQPPIGIIGAPVELSPVPERRQAAQPLGLTITSIPPPAGNAGIFVEYAGSRWFSAGPAVTFDPIRFRPVGTYHGFTVYAETGGDPDRIFIPAVPGGMLSPYTR